MSPATESEATPVAKSEIQIDENLCKGCGYCALYCARGCLVISQDKLTELGHELPTFTQPDRCTACGVCAWMCPEYAIDVYKCTTAER
jgi:2-oxoglutarate ferredoxin oxidoreductase subunit delta